MVEEAQVIQPSLLFGVAFYLLLQSVEEAMTGLRIEQIFPLFLSLLKDKGIYLLDKLIY